MSIHEVPENLDPVNVPGAEGVVMTIVSIALDHLLPLVTPSPQLTHPAVHPVHVGGVFPGLRVAVHVGDDLSEVHHLDVVIPAITGLYCVMGTCSQVTSNLWRPRNSVILQTVEVDNVHRSVWHGIESQKRSTTHRAHRGQAARQTLQGFGVDEHGAIGGS